MRSTRSSAIPRLNPEIWTKGRSFSERRVADCRHCVRVAVGVASSGLPPPLSIWLFVTACDSPVLPETRL